MRLSQMMRSGQHRGLSLHVLPQVEDGFRQAYLKLHTLKFDMDQMEEIPNFLHPLYEKVVHLADIASEAIREVSKVESLGRQVMKKVYP